MTGILKNIAPSKAGRLVSISPLVSFRIIFGLLMFGSILRFWYRGWVDAVYILPKFHFTYWGFEWVKPLPGFGMHLLFGLLALAALFIALGLFYRISAVCFFLLFTYVEMLDVTTYLNHYYFISLVAFILIWVPANAWYSLDARMRPSLQRTQVPAWTIGIIRFQMGVVYVFAGLAKLNADWLLRALPLRIWLPAKSELPIVGQFVYQEWMAYAFSWFGAIYDLFIVFFLLNARTRPFAYFFVVAFHIATAIFFPGIGMFPYVMVLSSLVFFSATFHNNLLSWLPGFKRTDVEPEVSIPRGIHPALQAALIIYVSIQILVPFRYLLYPGHLFWHEEGYRFSWRVMLMEKSGAAYFKVRDGKSGYTQEVSNAEFLTPLQEKMMSTQPDMILKYAHHLATTFQKRGMNDPQVYAEIFVSLNGERSRPFINSSVDLAAEPLRWGHYSWVLPYAK